MTVAHGHLSIYTSWQRDDPRVLLYLRGENYSSTLGIEYGGLNFEALEDHARESALIEDL